MCLTKILLAFIIHHSFDRESLLTGVKLDTNLTRKFPLSHVKLPNLAMQQWQANIFLLLQVLTLPHFSKVSMIMPAMHHIGATSFHVKSWLHTQMVKLILVLRAISSTGHLVTWLQCAGS